MKLFVLCSLLAACGAPQGALSSSASNEGWTRLREGAIGTWETTTESGQRIEVSYRMISNDSALLETWRSASGNETISVYHRDGERLVLTHYCAQGNQAHLVAVEADESRVRFHRVSATNLTSEQAVLDDLVLHSERDLLERTETYVDAGGTAETTVLRFTPIAR
jgi:hypothetical protein